MANTDKNIIITPSRGSEQDPNIVFSGANATSGPANITATVTPAANGTLTFSGTQGGNLLRIANDLSNTLYTQGNLRVDNTVSANTGAFTNITGNGAGITNVAAGNITGQVANALVAGTVYTNAQPNITSVGALSTLSVIGNANVGNLGTAGLITATGNIQGGNLRTGGILSVTGNANIGNIGVTGVFATTLSATGNANTGNIGATNGVFTNVSGNGASLTSITGANVTGTVANATFATSAGSATTATSATTAGTVTTAAQPNITSTGTLTSLSVSGNANTGNLGVTGVFATTLSATGNANTGNIGATNGVFTNVSGNGAGITYANASNLLTGTVPTGRVSGNYTSLTGTGILAAGSITTTFGNINIGTSVFTGNGSGLTALPASNITGQVANALVAGTVYTAAQPNITSVGTLTSLTIDGNLVVGNNLFVNGNLTYLNVETVAIEDPIIQLQTGPNGAALTSNTGKDVGTALNYYDTVAKTAFMGWDTSNVEIAFGSNVSITNEIVTFTQLANTRSGNTLTTGVFATTLSATGNANVGNIGATNGVFTNVSGNGAALTALNGSNITTGTVAAARVATLNQNTTGSAATVTTAAQPNITSVGTLTSLSVSGNANIGNIGTAGLITATGNIQGNNILVGTGAGTSSGDDNLVRPGSTSAFLNLKGGSGRSKITLGNDFVRIISGSDTITFGSNAANSTDAGTTRATINSAGLSVTGIISATGNANTGNIGATNGVFTNVSGNGALLTNITAGSITGQVANALVAGTVYTNAQPNITSVGTLTSLAVTGNANANVFYAGNGTAALPSHSFTSDTNTGIYSIGADQVGISTGGTLRANISNTGLVVTGVLSSTGNANVGNLGVGIVTATGNITAPNFIGNFVGTFNFANGNSNISIPAANGNINFSVGGQANEVVFTSTGANVNGYLSVSGNANIANIGTAGLITATGAIQTSSTLSATGNANVGNLGTAGLITATGNINTSARLISTVATGTAPLVVNSTTQVANLNAATAGTATSATTAGTVTTAAQPNITSVGTLTSLAVTGNANANIFYAGNGTAALPSHSFTSDTNTGIYRIGADQLGISTGGVLRANISNTGLVVTGVISSTGNANVGNLGTAGLITATGTIKSNSSVIANGQMIINSSAGAGEGAQMTMAYKGIGGLTGQANSTWNLDVDASNNFRMFSVNASGVDKVGISVAENGNVTFGGNLIFSGNLTRIGSDTTVFTPTSTNGNSAIDLVPSGTGNLAVVNVYSNSDRNNSQSGQFYSSPSVGVVIDTRQSGSATAPPLVLGANGIIRGTFNTSGEFYVAKTVADDSSQTGFIVSSGGRLTVTMDESAAINTYHLYNRNATNNGYRFYVNTNGGIYNYSANDVNLSDERVKTNIQYAGSYLSKICSIPVRTYLYKDQGDGLLNLGVIAQEVEAVAPEFVSNEGFGELPEDGIPLKTVYQTDIQFALMKCIQELNAEIIALKERLNDLENK